MQIGVTRGNPAVRFTPLSSIIRSKQRARIAAPHDLSPSLTMQGLEFRVLIVALACLTAACSRDGARSANGAEASTPPDDDAAIITQDMLRQHISVIADDSMLGRATPSRGLEQTAAYIAAHFERLGLRPLGSDGSFIQHYPLPTERTSRAPNVVGLVEGNDPALRREYLIFSAHMDHVGVGAPVNGDSIYNGADDNASGTAAVMALAEAFARSKERPRRSIIFLAVSGEERGLWGSAYFASHPPVPIDSVVAALNIDMVGRNWRDTIVAIGKEHSDLGGSVERVAAAHSELHLHPIDDPWPNEQFYFRSDHYNFARRGVPVLFFFSGTHADYHGPDDEVNKIDFEKEMRVARLLYHFGLEVANGPQRPKWNAESRRRIVGQQ